MVQVLKPWSQDYQMELVLTFTTTKIECTGQMCHSITLGLHQ